MHRTHREISYIAGVLLFGWFLNGPAVAEDLSRELAPITRSLDKVGNSICRTLDVKCKKPSKRAKARAASVKEPQPAKQAEAAPKPDTVTLASEAPPPIPRQKPRLPVKPVTAPVKTAAAETETEIPIPRAKPVSPARRLKPATRVEVAAPGPDVASLPPPSPVISPSDTSCLDGLRASKVEFEAAPQPDGLSGCRIDNPVRLIAVPTASGTVSLPEKPLLNCRFARQFSMWLSETGSAIVKAGTDKALTRVATGPGFECRGRNGDGSAKLSEHATGNAVDISTITMADGTAVAIADAASPSHPSFTVLKGLRTTACGYFTTVLGPGSNAAHAQHFHFDMGLHGKSGNYRICE